jgi:hypothetical protein
VEMATDGRPIDYELPALTAELRGLNTGNPGLYSPFDTGRPPFESARCSLQCSLIDAKSVADAIRSDFPDLTREQWADIAASLAR